jgi:putative cardiolipin synthase
MRFVRPFQPASAATLALAAIALLSGCASIDFDQPKSVTHAFDDTDGTFLGKQIDGLAEQHPGESGFYLQADGIEALASRILLAERAERSIDTQYYLIKDDVASHAFLSALLRAADRGVRVRLLVDDMFMAGNDAGIAGLDSHPNFEIRVFNPFARRSARFADGITSFSRINRRMHNKSFTIDNQVTIIGGRNIADEYFAARADVNFGDLDVLTIGPIVNEVSAMFDGYWNHERAAPVEMFADLPDDPAAELERVRGILEASAENIATSRYADAVRAEVVKHIETDAGAFHWAPYVLAVDSPDKIVKSRAETAQSITTTLAASLLSAEDEIIIVSPYFVPGRDGIRALSEIQKKGVNVIVITNSLAANNHVTVHGGYAPSRKPLLRNGVRIFEYRPDAHIEGTEIVADDDALATLHTKAFLVDGREFFIGSFNFDPRSANINTELGVIIRSPEMAAAASEAVHAALSSQAYEVFLNDDDKLRWRSQENGQEVIYKKDPKTSWFKRFLGGFMRLVPMRGQL